MLESKRQKIEKATQTANDKFARAVQREADFRKEKQKVLDADAVKTARLRALRLAKEAEDLAKAAAEKELLAKEAAERRSRLKRHTPPTA